MHMCESSSCRDIQAPELLVSESLRPHRRETQAERIHAQHTSVGVLCHQTFSVCFLSHFKMQLSGSPAKLALGRLPVPLNTSNYRAQSCRSRQTSLSNNDNSPVRDVACDAHAQRPPQLGLVAGAPDKDACGVGFVGELSKLATRKCVTDALDMLVRMTHRGACGCEENTGDHSETAEMEPLV